MSDQDTIPVTPAVLSFALAIQLAAEAYRSEGILARNLQLPKPQSPLERAQALFDQYVKPMAEHGILSNRKTFETLFYAAPPDELRELEPEALAKLWRFNPWRGWFLADQA